MSQPIQVKTPSEAYIYPIKNKKGDEFMPPKGRSWQFSKERFLELVKDNRIWFGEDGSNVPRIKKFLSEVKEGVIPRSIWLYSEVGSNDDAKRSIKDIFSESENPFGTPKPISLIKRIVELSTNKDDIILDSFAGSGTTAQAVLELNKEDGGTRKFILVEQEDYANTITAERVRRVMKGIPTSKNETLQKGTGGSFSYFELGPTIEMESLLRGENLPAYEELARYVFYTATGVEFEEKKIDRSSGYIGETENYELYMQYEPDIEWLKQHALTLDGVRNMPTFTGKQRLVFAPAKYVDDYTLLENRVDFCQLPYEIYRIKK
jgi:adenine-specific DNA-methyltransferase